MENFSFCAVFVVCHLVLISTILLLPELDDGNKRQKEIITVQKMKFFIKDFFSKCDQIRTKVRIWSHLLKKSLIDKFIF